MKIVEVRASCLEPTVIENEEEAVFHFSLQGHGHELIKSVDEQKHCIT